jgi:hypothetical protein
VSRNTDACTDPNCYAAKLDAHVKAKVAAKPELVQISTADGGKVLRAAAQTYGVDTDAVAIKVKQEFAAKEKAREAAKPDAKPAAKATRSA